MKNGNSREDNYSAHRGKADKTPLRGMGYKIDEEDTSRPDSEDYAEIRYSLGGGGRSNNLD